MSKQEKSNRTVVLLHGYGVRGSFWRYLKPVLAERFEKVRAPDLEMSTLETMTSSTSSYCRTLAHSTGQRLILVGHSLGGVLAAIVAQELGADVVDRVVIIAAPYGEHRMSKVGAAITRLLIRFRLIPDAVARRRFFSDNSPTERQKTLFAEAVPESAELQNMLFAPVWFHTKSLVSPLPVPSLVIASEFDKVVPYTQTLQFAEVLSSQTRIFAVQEQVAHDDFAAAPIHVQQTADIVYSFAGESR
ncbi:MAG: alpha/beta hydrolase [Spirochaetaceae bacterium]|nr:MAG: alpha/beta hydrolase [Spirochaetaceae bacterium]